MFYFNTETTIWSIKIGSTSGCLLSMTHEQENLAHALIDFQNSDEIPVFIFVFKLNVPY